MIFVQNAQYLKDYQIQVQFSDGSEGVVDLKETLWGPIFEPLKDLEVFQRFEISPIFKTLAWPNGADLAPEYLYQIKQN